MMRALPALALFCAACQVTASVGDTPDELWTELRLGSTNNNQIDLLFMIDNSPSMAPKQDELRQRFPLLLQALDDNAAAGHPAHYHIGVITSDLGAGMNSINGNQCRPGGDGGRLQAVGASAPSTCQPPLGGVNYIDLDQVNHNDNVPPGLTAADLFTCMATVGDQGCGFEAQLESVYQALHDPAPLENQGFLRGEALLAIVFLTDEDDCSAPPDTDLFDFNAVQYGALLSYRCTQYGVACGSPPVPPPYGSTDGPLTGCAPAANPDGTGPGKLFDVSRYINFFRLPRSAGGVKEFPADLILFAIDGPASPFSTLVANIKAPPGPYQPCAGGPDGTSCAVVLQHSCIRPNDTSIFGDPAVRLNAVVSTTQQSPGTEICDDSYAPAMSSLASTLISYQSGDGCLPGPIPDEADPSCRVYDEIVELDGTSSRNYFAECDRVAQSPPCWSVETASDCKTWINQATNQSQTLKLTLDRGGQPVPDGATTRAACVILTH